MVCPVGFLRSGEGTLATYGSGTRSLAEDMAGQRTPVLGPKTVKNVSFLSFLGTRSLAEERVSLAGQRTPPGPQNSEKRKLSGPRGPPRRSPTYAPSPSPPPGPSRPGPDPLPGALATYRPDLLDETALYSV